MLNKNETNIKDCLECRIVGGISISLIGLYLWSQAKRRRGVERNVIQIISCGTFGVGLARLLNFFSFRPKTKEND